MRAQKSISAWAASSEKLLADYARADAISGGRLAAIPCEPLQGWLMPSVSAGGTLKAVVFINTTLDASWPTKLKLRGLSPTIRAMRWYGLDGSSRICPVSHDGRDAFVVLPEVAPWDGGYLAAADPVALSRRNRDKGDKARLSLIFIAAENRVFCAGMAAYRPVQPCPSG